MMGRLALLICLLYACESGDDGRSSGTGRDADSNALDGAVTGDATEDGATTAPDDDASGDPDATTSQPGGDGTAVGTADGVNPGDDATTPLEDTAAGDPAGTPCVSDDACSSGWCVPSAIGQVCVEVCVDVCDPGQACIPAADSGTDPVYLCIPFEPPDTGSEEDAVGSDTVEDAGPGVEVSDDTSVATDVPVGDSGPEDVTPDDTSVGDATDPGPDVPDTDTTVTDQDSDGDGFPDDEDNLPCLAIYLIVYNNNVSSASLHLNGFEVIAPNAFPTTEPITIFINPTTGENTLSLGGKLTGSPTDTLTLVVVDTEGHIYFAVVIQRESGQPDEPSYTFTIDATCD